MAENILNNPCMSVSFTESGAALITVYGEDGNKVTLAYGKPEHLSRDGNGLVNIASMLDWLQEVGWEQFCDLTDYDTEDETSSNIWEQFKESG